MSKRLNVEDPKVFDLWRELYSDLSDAEQAEFYDDLEAKYPWQQHFHLDYFNSALYGKPGLRVLEVGGWKGEMASQMLATHAGISAWHNIELCKKATDKTVYMPRDGVYTFENPASFTWFKAPRTVEADVFICAHTIEHFQDQDLWSLLSWADGIPLVCLEAPIAMGTNDWSGYGGTHILKAGWCEIGVFMQAQGYEPIFISPHCFRYLKA